MIILYIILMLFILFVFSGYSSTKISKDKVSELCSNNFEYNGQCYKYYEVNLLNNNGVIEEFVDKDGNLLVLSRDNLPSNLIFISDSPEILDSLWFNLRITFRRIGDTTISGDAPIYNDNNNQSLKATNLINGETVLTSNPPYTQIVNSYPDEYALGFIYTDIPSNTISGNLKILIPL